MRAGADGVLINGCREGGCEFRLGQRWTAQRLSGEREPHLRSSVPAERWRTAWTDPGDERALVGCRGRIAQALRCLRPPELEEKTDEPRTQLDRPGPAVRQLCRGTLGVFTLACVPPLPPDMAQIKVSFIHHGQRIADAAPSPPKSRPRWPTTCARLRKMRTRAFTGQH